MHYGALEWNMADVKGMDPLILYASLDKCNVNPTIQEVVQTDILNFSTLALSINSRLQVDESNPSCFQKSKVTVAQNKDWEKGSTHTPTSWHTCIDYRKLSQVTRKDHFPLFLLDQVLEKIVEYEFYCFLDDYFGYYHIEIAFNIEIAFKD